MIISQTSTDSFFFNEFCKISYYEIDQDKQWSIEAYDWNMPFMIGLIWNESFISGPGSFQAFEGYDELSTWIMRAHPTDPGWYSFYSVNEGIVTFTQVGYQSGDIIEGTFDQLRVYDWEADERIEVDDGSFLFRVQ
jgi:hypothetical protein